MLEPQEAGQPPRGIMAYPDRGWRWLFYRLPFWLWRMGAAPLMSGRFCLLSTIGRKSGRPRHTLLEYAALDGRAYLLAGWGPRAHWVRNILADARVALVSGLGTQRGRAVRVVDAETIRRLYPQMTKSPVWGPYTESLGVDGRDVEDVVAKADRLWAFRVEPSEEAGTPAPGGMDLWWLTAGAAAAGVAAALAC